MNNQHDSASYARLPSFQEGYPSRVRPWFTRRDCVTQEILTLSAERWRHGDVASCLSLAEAAVESSCNRCPDPCSSFAGLYLAVLLASIRKTAEARLVVQDCEASGDPRLVAILKLVKSKIALTDGELSAAAILCDSGLRLANELLLSSWIPIGNLVGATIALRRGELATMIHYADQLKVDAIFDRERFPSNMPAWLIVQIIEAEKGWKAAVPLARELLDSESTTRMLLLAEPTSIPFLVRMVLAAGDKKLALRATRYAAMFAAENPDIRSLSAGSLHAQGLVQDDVEMLRRATEEYGEPWGCASANEDIGRLLSARGEATEKVCESFDLAMRAYTDTGSLRDSSRVRRRLRMLDTPTAATRFWPSSQIQGLTDAEYAVAKLVSEGLTNGQVAGQMFLSRHTVAFHLRKIFQKIGVKSRVELAVMWNELVTEIELAG